MARHPEDKIATLLDAALAVFAVSGPEGARVDAIARAAGMNKRLLYHYVGDKQALFDAVARAAVTRLAGAAAPGDDPAAWRVLCHAVSAGRCPDLAPLVERIGGQSRQAIGGRLLNALLPELARALPETTPVAGAPAASAPAASAPVASAAGASRHADPKPRIKLRPSLTQTADGGGS